MAGDHRNSDLLFLIHILQRHSFIVFSDLVDQLQYIKIHPGDTVLNILNLNFQPELHQLEEEAFVCS